MTHVQTRNQDYGVSSGRVVTCVNQGAQGWMQNSYQVPVTPDRDSDGMADSGSNGSVKVATNAGGDFSEDSCSSETATGASSTPAKKKTPMCLINELARHHKLQPQYKLTNETGLAHQKTFTVNLRLGEEEYVATGPSIKKAQHAAAQMALDKTTYPRPEAKTKPRNNNAVASDKPITPTVELNALAMKLGLSPVYTTLPPVPSVTGQDSYGSSLQGSTPYPSTTNTDFQAVQPSHNSRYPVNYNQRFFYNRYQPNAVCHRVSLKIGDVSVTGEGGTPQLARHNAAKQALKELSDRGTTMGKDSCPSVNCVVPESECKSPVSQVHELALKMSENVEFSVLSESGPPHMRIFVVACKLAEWTTQGEGNCKKLAKKKAAECMLVELKKAHPTGISRPVATVVATSAIQKHRPKSKPVSTRKKQRTLEIETPAGATVKAQDPISHLVQLQQSRKEKEPEFVVTSERGIPRQPEFVVQVNVGSVTAVGVGAKKKDAKRAAAQKALQLLGVVDEADTSTTSATTTASAAAATAAPTIAPNTVTNRQMIPGVIHLGAVMNRPSESVLSTGGQNSTQPKSCPAETKMAGSGGVQPESSLMYLAKVLGYEVEYADFPKGVKGDFLSLVTLNTTPPKVTHGSGSTLIEAHNSAAANMLKLLAEGGLDVGGSDCEDVGKENVQFTV